MKFFRVIGFLAIFFGSILFNQVQGMERPSPVIVILNGPTCSGKTSLAKAFMQSIEDRHGVDWSYVALDDIEMEESEDFEVEIEDLLHTELLRKVEYEVSQGRSVLCDTVIDDRKLADKKWFDLYKEKLSKYRVLFVFVHCPLKILIQRLDQRNIHAHRSGDVQAVRRAVDILYAYGRMYKKSKQEEKSEKDKKPEKGKDCGLGEFTRQELKHIIGSICETNVSPRDWCQLGGRYKIFDIREGESFFFKLKNPHDLIVHNYFQPLRVPLIEGQQNINRHCVRQIIHAVYPI